MKVTDLQFGLHTVTKVFVLRRRSGEDIISFEFGSAPTTHPGASDQTLERHSPDFTVRTQKGYAEQWLQTMFGIDASDPAIEIVSQEPINHKFSGKDDT